MTDGAVTERCTAVLEKQRAHSARIDTWRCSLPAGHYGDTHYSTSGWKWYGAGRTRRNVDSWLAQDQLLAAERTSWTATLLPEVDHVWNGDRLPVLYERDRCLYCGSRAQVLVMIQDPLFVHAGYGEAIRTRTQWCPSCHYSTLLARESVRPHLQMTLAVE